MNSMLNDTFCPYPWTQVYIEPTGNLQACCRAVPVAGESLGNIKTESIAEIFNNENFVRLREEFLNGNKPAMCQECWTKERMGMASGRGIANKNHPGGMQRFGSVTADLKGIEFLDLRFSNLCNLACVTCGPGLSSSWKPLREKMRGVAGSPDAPKVETSLREDFLTSLEPCVAGLRQINFAGGEPLLMPEAWAVLDWLGRHPSRPFERVKFHWQTNGSVLGIQGRSIAEHLSAIRHWEMAMSIDEANAERLHYIRHPLKLDKWLENWKALAACADEAGRRLTVAPTWSVLNLHRISACVEEWVALGIPIEAIRFHQLAIGHTVFSACYTPDAYKEAAAKSIAKTIGLVGKSKEQTRQTQEIKALGKFLFSSAQAHTANRRDFIHRLDAARGTDIAKTFPELPLLLNL